jgi:hypothetical protein
MSTARSSVVTSRRISRYFRAKRAASLPIAACEKSSGALTLNLPRGVSPPEAIAAAVSSISVSSTEVLLEQRTPFLGELQRPRAALEEAQVQPAFQVGHPPRQRGLGAP